MAAARAISFGNGTVKCATQAWEPQAMPSKPSPADTEVFSFIRSLEGRAANIQYRGRLLDEAKSHLDSRVVIELKLCNGRISRQTRHLVRKLPDLVRGFIAEGGYGLTPDQEAEAIAVLTDEINRVTETAGRPSTRSYCLSETFFPERVDHVRAWVLRAVVSPSAAPDDREQLSHVVVAIWRLLKDEQWIAGHVSHEYVAVESGIPVEQVARLRKNWCFCCPTNPVPAGVQSSSDATPSE
jgi:hypothetical protein